MIRSISTFAACLFLLLLGACSKTTYQRIDTLKPATYTFPPYVRNVLFLNQTAALKSARANTDNLFADTLRIDIAKEAQQFLSDLSTKIAQEKRIFDQVVAADIPPELGSADTLSYEQTREIRAVSDAQVLVTLSQWNFHPEIFFYEMPDGGIEAVLTLPLKALFRIYLPGNIRPQEHWICDTLSIRGYGGMPDQAFATLPDLETALNMAIPVFAERSAADFTPVFQEEERTLFVPQTSLMRDADRLARKGNWQEAFYLWEHIYLQEKNLKIKGMAAFNAALALEMQDQLPPAITWIERSLACFKETSKNKWSTLALNYQKRVQERIEENNLLTKQLR